MTSETKRSEASASTDWLGEDYKRLKKLPAGAQLDPCPVCGAPADLWEYSKDFKAGPITRAVMCTNGAAFGPQDDEVHAGCPLYLPPRDFYQATTREAIKYWNQYAVALVAQRLQRMMTPN